jgi:Mg2+ and Co2+ transporter CorA
VKVKQYRLASGRLTERPASGKPGKSEAGKGETLWIDIQEADTEELRDFLSSWDLHPLQEKRCFDAVNTPGVVTHEGIVLLEYPAALAEDRVTPTYLTILLKGATLVTIRHGLMPTLDELASELTGGGQLPLLHLPQVIYMILDEFADMNVQAQVGIRDRIAALSQLLAKKTTAVKWGDLAHLRGQLETLISQVENQLYCITGLNACDSEVLQDPHRKAYLQDLVSEMEIAQRGVYRLEARVKDLFSDFQAIGNDRVEKRLRLLTIVSAITLPLGLVAGLLGMNVGGLPGTTAPLGFVIVVGVMLVITLLEYWYFKKKGWFD